MPLVNLFGLRLVIATFSEAQSPTLHPTHTKPQTPTMTPQSPKPISALSVFSANSLQTRPSRHGQGKLAHSGERGEVLLAGSPGFLEKWRHLVFLRIPIFCPKGGTGFYPWCPRPQFAWKVEEMMNDCLHPDVAYNGGSLLRADTVTPGSPHEPYKHSPKKTHTQRALNSVLIPDSLDR